MEKNLLSTAGLRAFIYKNVRVKICLNRPYRHVLSIFCFFLLLAGATLSSRAQTPTLSYQGPVTYNLNQAVNISPSSSGVGIYFPTYGVATPFGSGFSFPGNMTTDAAGNVYVIDGGSNSIKKIPAGNGTPVIWGSGVTYPLAVASDLAGNIYVIDAVNNSVKKIPAGNGAATQVASGFSEPLGIAVDPAGNIYVTDLGSGVLMIPVSGIGPPVLLAARSAINLSGGIAVDAAGNVYVTDLNAGIKKIPAGGGTPVTVGPGIGTNGFKVPTTIAIDAAGNLYVGDNGTQSIKLVPAVSPNQAYQLTLPATAAGQVSITVDGTGNIYMSNFQTNAVQESQPQDGYYLSPLLPPGLTFSSTTGAISGYPTAANSITSYTVIAYNDGASASATLNLSYNRPPTPTISYPGPGTYNLSQVINISATSTNVGNFFPSYGAAAPFGFGFSYPENVTTDPAGNVYVVTAGGSSIKKIPAGNGTPITWGSGFTNPIAVASDLAGNIYVTDAGNGGQTSGIVYKIPAGNGTPTVVASGLSELVGIAVDQPGNIYVVGYGSGVQMIPVSGIGPPVTLAASSALNISGGITVDAAGNVYVTDTKAGIKKIPAGGGPPVTIGPGIGSNGFTTPTAIAIDAAGNLYVSDNGTQCVKVVTVSGQNYAIELTPPATSSGQVNMTLDGAGNIYLCNSIANSVQVFHPQGGYYLSPLLPPGLTFNGSTGAISGSATAANTVTGYTITAYNSAGVSASAALSLSYNRPPAPTLSYPGPNTYNLNQAINIPATTTNVPAASLSVYSGPSAFGFGFNSPGGLTTDASGNVYEIDQGTHSVKRIPAGNGTPVSWGSGFINPIALASDLAGNIYVTDAGTGAQTASTVYKIPAGNGTPTVVASGFGFLTGIALDEAGNIYVVDLSAGIKMIPVSGIGPPVLLAANSSTLSPEGGITVDAVGNIYVTDSKAGIKKIPAGGGTPVTVGPGIGSNGFTQPFGIAIDAGGNLYVGDNGSQSIKFLPSGQTYAYPISAAIFGNQGGMTMDGAGNIYVSNTSTSLVQVLHPQGGFFLSPLLPPGLTFNGNTGAITGSPTAANTVTSYIVTAYNSISVGASATLSLSYNKPPAPTLSYPGPNTYTLNQAVNISATSTNVPAASLSFYSGPSAFGFGFNSPGGLTTDASGNVYEIDQGTHSVKRIPAGNGTPVSWGSGFINPIALASDLAGNIYVTDAGTGAQTASTVYKIPAGNGTPTVVASGFGFLEGIAVDQSGNIYVIDLSAGVKMLPVSGIGPPVLLAANSSTLSPEGGITVDAAGNVYVTDSKAGIKKIPAGGGTPVTVGPGIGSNGFTQPFGIAIDAGGNLYVGDNGSQSVKFLPYGQTYAYPISAAVFGNQGGMTMDGAGNIYVSNTSTNSVAALHPQGGYFLSPLLPPGVIFNGNTGAISGSPTAANTLTSYTVTAYNSISASTSATLSLSYNRPPAPTLSYPGPNTYSLNQAVNISATSTNVPAASLSIYSAASSFGFGFNSPGGLTTDALGNVYEIDQGSHSVKRIPAGNGTPVSWGSGFINPIAVASDLAGNIYVTDAGSGNSSTVYKIPAGNGTPTTVASGFGFLEGIAVDHAGNIYVIDLSAGVKMLPVSGIGPPVLLAANSSTLSPEGGITVDAAGNVYVTDSKAGIKKIPAGGGTPVTVGPGIGSNGFTQPFGIAIDAGGNLYVGDNGSQSVKFLPYGQTYAYPISAAVFGNQGGLAIDGAGNIYVSNTSTNSVAALHPQGGYFLSPLLPPGVIFNGNTGAITGSPTAANGLSSYTVTAYNSVGASATATLGLSTLTSTELSGLLINPGTLAPAFSPLTSNYTATVPSNLTSLEVYIGLSNTSSTIKINGTSLAQGIQTTTVALNPGINTIIVLITSADGTKTNTYTLTVTRPFTPPGNALAFDGVADGVTMGTPPATVSGSFTVEAWVRPVDGTKDMHIFSTRSTGDVSFDIQIMNGNTIHGDIGTGTAWLTTSANAGFNYNAGQWIHIAYVVTTTGYSIYANGNPVGSGTFSGTPLLLNNTHNTTIGFDPGESTYFNGSIDEVRVYNAALSQANIQADMLSTASSVPLNLVNYYDFDNGVAGATNTGITTLTDRTTTGYNGTLSNFALSGTTSNWVESYAMVVPTATAATAITSTGFTANWTAPITGIVTNYFVDVSTSSTFAQVISGSPFSTTSTSMPVSGLTEGNTYYYRVRADKTSVTGQGDYSAVITAVPVSHDASLAGLSTAPGTLSPVFAAGTTAYADTISGVTSVLVTALTNDPHATVTMLTNGTGFSNGATATIPLSLGNNNIVITVTAQDGTTTGTYTVTVNMESTPVNITFNALPAVTYGNGDFSPAATSSNGGVPITYTSDNAAVASIVNGNIHIVSAGTANITASQAGDATHSAPSNVIQQLTVNQAPLTITADNQAMTYGGSVPVLTAEYSGFVNGDNATSLTTVPAIITTGTPASPVNAYPITPSGAADPNYSISYVNGTLTIGQAALIIIADNQAMTYGGSVPALTASYSGFVNGDNAASLTTAPGINTGGTSASPANTYPINPAGAVDPNYSISYVSGTLFINQAPLTIMADNQSMTYGGSVPNLTAEYYGFVNGDNMGTLTTAPAITTTGTPSSPVNNYPITPAGAVDPNYLISYAPGTLTIGQAALTVTANSQAINYGTPIPTLTASYNGFVNGDNAGSLTTPPTITTTGTSTSAPGQYPVTPSGAVDSNYGISYVAGTLTVIPSSDATLSSVTISTGSLTSTGANTYTASVANGVTMLNITPVTSNAQATLTVNGSPAPSGSPVTISNLSVGANVITLSVTAQDGTTIGTYTITVARAPLSNPPAISYNGSQTYFQNTAVTPLSPTSSNVAAPGYATTPLVVGSGFSGPTGVAIDAAGNVYVADRGNHMVKKIPAGNGTPVIISSGFTLPYGVAVDAAGDVYVADYGASAVYKIAAGSNSRVTIGSGFKTPTGVAIDAAGDLYVADYGNNAIKKIPAGSSTPQIIGTGFSEPAGIAVDAQGNVYVGDRGHNAVKEIPAGTNTPQVIGSGFNNPFGVAVDASGNVYVGDFNNNQVKMIPAGSNTPQVIGSGFSDPDGIAADGAGKVYVADYGNNAVKQIIPAGGFYIGPFLPAGLNFNNTTGTISGVPNVVGGSPATNYTVTAYNLSGSSTATVNITVMGLAPGVSYTGPQGYTVGTAITPLTPTSSNVAGLAYSNATATLGSGFSGPTGVAIDAAGNIYVADRVNKVVKKIPAGSNTPQAISASFSAPYGIAVDAAGDIYVADYSANAVFKVPGGNGTRVTIGSGFKNPTGVAIDAAGDVYVADYGNNAVKEIPAGSNTPQVIGSGFSEPVGIAVDAQGNVYIGDRGNNAVKKIPAGSNTPQIIGSGFNNPFGVAVDASGNVYVGDFNNNQVKMIPAGTNTPVVIGSGFSNPDEVAVDGAGNVYVADNANNAVKQIKPVGGYYIGPFLPAGLSFNNTTGAISGTPTASSPATNYTVTAYNNLGSTTAAVNIAVLSNNANLANLTISSGPLSPVFATGTPGYTASVPNTVSSVTLTPTTSDPAATVKVNGTPVTSGTASVGQPLVAGPNTITTVVTAQNGATQTYTITVTQAGPGAAFRPVNYTSLADSASTVNDGILVHQGISPNGDGINDFLVIDGITQYPENHLMIINRNGALIYQEKGYDNTNGVFDGHSNINGKMQLPGTYFYSLDYNVNGLLKHRTGYIVLKY